MAESAYKFQNDPRFTATQAPMPAGMPFTWPMLPNSPCPVLTPANPVQVMPGPIYHVQPGCICPAGANKDCEAPMCPRKAHKPAGAM